MPERALLLEANENVFFEKELFTPLKFVLENKNRKIIYLLRVFFAFFSNLYDVV
jgi:hypothetical protein